jgi:hypothetical protein
MHLRRLIVVLSVLLSGGLAEAAEPAAVVTAAEVADISREPSARRRPPAARTLRG